MKKGLLIYNSYNNIFNIGDYVQSLAASQFFDGKVDSFVNRENLQKYSGEKLKIIMNGWFMHEPQNWPPSTDIEPLFVSFHINSVAKKQLLTSDSIKYFKKWQPIGCRDRETARLLKEMGVDAYFSGCLTVTLGETNKSKERSKDVYFVDPYFEYKKDAFSLFKYNMILWANYKVVKKVSLGLFKSKSITSLLKAAAFYKDYSATFEPDLLRKATYMHQGLEKDADFSTEEEKFNYAKEILGKFSAAKLVITSRIHCALPSLGMNTPVIYVENKNQSETSYCRLEGLRELFNIITYDKGRMICQFEGKKGKINDHFIFQNKDNFVKLKESLIESCKAFVAK